MNLSCVNFSYKFQIISSFFKKRAIRDIFSLSGAQAGLQVINVVKGFIVAKYLGPEHYGILKSAELITMLEKFGNLGFRSVAIRELSSLKGQNNVEKENEVRNTAYTSEIIFTTILFLVGICSSIFFKSKIIVVVVLLASVHLFFSKLAGILNTEAVIEKKFVLLSKILFWIGLCSAVIVIITVPFLKIYAVMVVPILAAIASAVWFFKNLNFNYHFHIKKRELIRQLKIGIPLMLATLSYGSYRYSERLIVLLSLGLTYLGHYSLASMISNNILAILLTAIKVRKITIFEKLGQKRYLEVHRIVRKETSLLVLGAIIFVLFSWFLIDIVIPRFLVKYQGAISICKILLLAVPFQVISSYMHIVLISPSVDKQVYLPPLRFATTLIFVLSVFILRYYNMASIINIVIADVTGYVLFNLSRVFLYKKYFMNVYIKTTVCN